MIVVDMGYVTTEPVYAKKIILAQIAPINAVSQIAMIVVNVISTMVLVPVILDTSETLVNSKIATLRTVMVMVYVTDSLGCVNVNLVGMVQIA
jgi:hypothetical protein